MSQDEWPELGWGNSTLIEDQYNLYIRDPSSVLPSWRDYFRRLPQSAATITAPPPHSPTESTNTGDVRVQELIQAYRTHGHRFAHLNCLNPPPQEEPAQLHLANFGLGTGDLAREYPTFGVMAKARAPLSEIIATLKAIYCNKIGVEFVGFVAPEVERWLQEQLEAIHARPELSIEEKKMILDQLNRSELLERFLHKNYVGQKRFSLEGGETLIPMLYELVDKGAAMGYEQFVLGMAHRGRLNVLSNILEKSYSEIFSEFEEGYISDSFEGSGDVKYHKGFGSTLQSKHGHKVVISLTPNPSHLESVYPVVEGQVRAKQVKGHDESKSRVLPIIIHGDAAVAGQGVVYETMQMMALPGYANGGTVHIVINNQIGFTTLPKDARSTRYCTDVAKAFGSPIFHVNAEYPEDCVYATLLALQIRHRFHCDVFIDLNCYRKYGHNETDEPAFTQPLDYQIIRNKTPIRELYRAELIARGVLEREVAETLEADFDKALHSARSAGKQTEKPPTATKDPKPDVFSAVDTSIDHKTLVTIAERFCTVPPDFNLHPKLQQLLQSRLQMVRGESPIDWGMAEHLAIGSLLWEGYHVRLSGQDSRRGTFSHRHAMWMDQKTEAKYFPLSHMKAEQGRFDVFNSPLSEYADLAFEFGYSVAYPDSLVLWEAQFGDFSNGAQIVIDQYIATAEQKWGLHFDLVLLLPHGYEGQGPEHSSGRMERFLVLCGQNNMYVVDPTTPAQIFHLLRRQLHTPFRKPLVVFTPKGLLRYPQCVSSIEELAQGTFQEILDDPAPPKKARRLVFCTGRIYYDLATERAKDKKSDLALIRIEQLYPLHPERLQEIADKYADAKHCFWVQEEPSNMGAWGYMQPQLEKILRKGQVLQYIGRERSASPAVGSYARHKQEHAAIMQALFGNDKRG